MKNIISCSRRTDIPAFHYNWLQDALKAEEAILNNPYSNTEYRVDLAPDRVHSIVLWSKNYSNVLKDPGLLDKYNLYFQFTITGYSKLLEPNVISYTDAISQVEALSKRYSPEQIMWRFDPVLFCTDLLCTEEEAINNRLNMFETLCKEISRLGVNKCTTSFVTFYEKTKKRFLQNNIVVKEISDDEKCEFSKKMVDVSKIYNIQLFSCCESILEHVEGIKKAHCVDGELLEQLFGNKTSKSKDKGQRLTCGCSISKDIGNYTQKCAHQCVYCYANPS